MTTKRHALTVEPRTVLGKQVKQLRRQGIIPANVYGHNVDSVAISIEGREFMSTLKAAGETGLIDLKVSSESKARPVLITSMLRHPVTDAVLHADFYQVNLKEKLTANVPLEFVGEPALVKTHEAMVQELLQEVEVECLPTDIPSSIEVDTTILTEINQGILVSQLTVPEGVEIKTDPEEMIVKLASAHIEETKEELAEEAAAEEAKEDAAAEAASASESTD